MTKTIFCCALWLALGACEKAGKTTPPPAPVALENTAVAGGPATVRFTAESAARLGLATALVESAALPNTRLVGGEVIVPPGRTTIVNAPVGGELRAAKAEAAIAPGAAIVRGEVLLRLVPFASIDRDVRARVERELSATRAQLTAAEARVTRISQAGADQAVSRRSVEEAVAARDILRADVQAAEARAHTTQETPLLSDVALTIRAPDDGVIRALSAAPGQAVAAGAPLFELVSVATLQVRVPVYDGDLVRLAAAAPARVRALSAPQDAFVVALPIGGPPTASPERATVDRYFGLTRGATFAPGERVLVELPLRGAENARNIPRGALLYDAQGAAWVYACAGQHAFQRIRIEPLRVDQDHVVFTHGPALGSCVASAAVTQIFGSEFEPGH